ncbi:MULTISPECIES: antitoxin VbhA family protein [unclassified Pseudonocardia]|uniref:antitoxin VbhA family protein n=1 Tax=unclassified Pseudonocardia TaxID=2619320 RepID=UPI0001FFEEA3|nr:antitoxin VbhA family protein [Pseudonocardia sp. Ae707_Ps1]OLM09237.1 hypothetical protein Ae707Ps1_6184c [Pseudonocardia sp. Ae707_Ps1]
MSLDQEHRAAASARRVPLPPPAWDQASRDALASVRAEGLEPGPDAIAALRAIGAGETTAEDAVAAILAPYRAA